MNRRVSLSSASALVLSLLVVVAGCGAEPTAPTMRPDGLRVGEVAQAVVLPYRTVDGTFSSTIGPQGGVLRFGLGSLTFPPGAVSTPQQISATVESSVLAVTFAPHGLAFPTAARPELRLSLVGVTLSEDRLQMAYLSDNGVALELLPTFVDSWSESASASLKHFSTYVMGAH